MLLTLCSSPFFGPPVMVRYSSNVSAFRLLTFSTAYIHHLDQHSSDHQFDLSLEQFSKQGTFVVGVQIDWPSLLYFGLGTHFTYKLNLSIQVPHHDTAIIGKHSLRGRISKYGVAVWFSGRFWPGGYLLITQTSGRAAGPVPLGLHLQQHSIRLAKRHPIMIYNLLLFDWLTDKCADPRACSG